VSEGVRILRTERIGTGLGFTDRSKNLIGLGLARTVRLLPCVFAATYWIA
jgi:hypothetical protein